MTVDTGALVSGGTSFPPPRLRGGLGSQGLAAGRTPGPPPACGPSTPRAVLTAAAPPRTEKQCYRESYVSDARDADQDAEPAGSGDQAGADGRPPSLRSRLSADSRCSSLSLGFEVNPQRTGPAEPEEMSVDEPEGVAALPAEEPPSSPSSSQNSPGTVDGGRGGRVGDTWDQGTGSLPPG